MHWARESPNGFLLLVHFLQMGWFKCTVHNKKLGRSLGMRLQNSSILHRAACALAHRFFKHWSLTKWFKPVTEAWVQMWCSFLHLYTWAQNNYYSTHCIKSSDWQFHLVGSLSRDVYLLLCWYNYRTGLVYHASIAGLTLGSVPNNSCFSFAFQLLE